MDFKWMKKHSTRLSGKDWRKLAKEYTSLKIDIEDLTCQLEKVRSRMIELSQGKNSYGAGVLIFHNQPKGRVDLKKLEKALDVFSINLDSYRVNRKRTPYFYIMD